MTIPGRLKDFLTSRPLPSTAFQLSTSWLTAARATGRNPKSGRHAILPLRSGSLEPSFDRPNIKDLAHLADRVHEALGRLDSRGRDISLLVSESCLKSVILSFEELPDSPAEREEFVLWRLKKQMPSLSEDIRLSFDVLNEGRPCRVFASVIRAAVLAEYEDLFARLGAKVRNVGLATLSLSGLLHLDTASSGILANIEEDSLSLLAVIDSQVVFYRSKPFLPDSREIRSFARRMDHIAREITNTVTFLEDREKARVETLWIRAVPTEGDDDPLTALKPLVPLGLKPVEPARWGGLKAREARLLAPLMGQLP